MKKFVGYVNGKSFDNEKDFNDAANKAIEENDGSLSISSYYSYTKDNQDEVKQIEDTKNDKYVSTYEYFLGESKPDVIDGKHIVYRIPEELAKRLEDASNKATIRENLNYHINKLDKAIDVKKTRSEDLQGEIEKRQNELYTLEEELKDLEARKNYYGTLFDVVDSEKEKSQDEDEQATKPVTKDRIKEVFGIDADMSLYSFLKQLGLLK